MNFDHKAVCVLITGKKGSGKTTYWLSRLVAHRAKHRFYFDPVREVSRKLKLRVCIDVPSMLAALTAGRPICFDSSPLFPGDRREGFAFFARWVMTVSKALPGVKLFGCDEFQSVHRTGPEGLPAGLKEITDEGRREEIDCIFAAQRINEVNDDVRGQLTEIVTFRHTDPLPLRWLAERGFDPVAVAALPAPGGWISINDDGAVKTNARRRPVQPDAAGKGNRVATAKG